jgi:hypothetical protein
MKFYFAAAEQPESHSAAFDSAQYNSAVCTGGQRCVMLSYDAFLNLGTLSDALHRKHILSVI